MSKTRSLSFIVIEGKRYPWKDILALRQAQLDAAPGRPIQIPLFGDLHEDRRPAMACTASNRYQEPGLFSEGTLPCPMRVMDDDSGSVQ